MIAEVAISAAMMANRAGTAMMVLVQLLRLAEWIPLEINLIRFQTILMNIESNDVDDSSIST